MYVDGAAIKGEQRFKKLAEFLETSFLSDAPDFGNSNEEIDEKLLEFYQTHYSPDNEHL